MVLATAYRRQKVSAIEPPAIGHYKASKRRYLQLGFAKIQTLCRPPPRLRISAANIGLNQFQQKRVV
jgi:hypothetical protein